MTKANINTKKVLAVASGGGHWVQLSLLSESFKHCDIHYVTTDLNLSAIESQTDLSVVIDADLSQKVRLIPLSIQMAALIIRKRPDYIISTGAAPGFFAVLFGQLIGAKTIWVDSMANHSKLSVSGKYASKFCDLCLTQWPHLADNKRVKYSGSLL
ncbi:hypothetical protein [Arenicella xantha]|uniref:Oligosaccharide biosynthesis protein Alg14 n=1 Tax=Arenicella xantha TaxID=644221 RepID=A0A395JNR5_9GAMM|nr:hypothetical protein [Arenicella xantha]RBP52953.1 oligosaccharide biosynthesis protein Alg14 [Arenicella xantha]